MPSGSLAARGGLTHTFGSLAGFLVVSFLCWGIYILEDAFADPINAGAAAVISSACIIAVGAILLFYLVKPGRRPHMADRHGARDSAAADGQPRSIPHTAAAHDPHCRTNLSC